MSLVAAAIGLLAGVLSGMFGVGGAVLTTPAVRALDYPALVAVGTPLLVVIPTAVAGALSYARRDLVDVRAGVVAGCAGALASVVGALAAGLVGGRVVLGVTAVLLLYLALDTARVGLRRRAALVPDDTAHVRGMTSMAALGAVTGLAAGFLGLGGGFILVPALARFFGFPLKRAIGTSLLVISFLAIPGSVTHWLLGHVDVGLALALMVGVVPGAILGARFTQAADERWVRFAFAALLLLTGGWLLAVQFA